MATIKIPVFTITIKKTTAERTLKDMIISNARRSEEIAASTTIVNLPIIKLSNFITPAATRANSAKNTIHQEKQLPTPVMKLPSSLCALMENFVLLLTIKQKFQFS